jgi:DNA-binding response OmpR family regulator
LKPSSPSDPQPPASTGHDAPIELFVIEDNVGDTVLIRQVVAECQIPIRLRIARDGEQALQMLADPEYYKPDLIILDLNVPKVSGTAFLQRYQRKEVPVVVFSSSQNEAEIRHAMDLGAKEFVQKPIDLENFTAAVHGIIDRWTAEGCTVR